FVGGGPNGYLAYDSFEESIRSAADYIGTAYARPGGLHYRGGTIAAVGSVYAADPLWPDKVARSGNYVGPSRGPAYAAAVQLSTVDGAAVAVHVVNEG